MGKEVMKQFFYLKEIWFLNQEIHWQAIKSEFYKVAGKVNVQKLTTVTDQQIQSKRMFSIAINILRYEV